MQTERGAYALDLATVVLLSVATLATSWGTYQATRWSGEQAGRYAQANDRRTESARAADLVAGQQPAGRGDVHELAQRLRRGEHAAADVVPATVP